MERAAVDRKARAASLQDELNATANEIEDEHQRGSGAMTGNPGLCGGGFLGMAYSTSKLKCSVPGRGVLLNQIATFVQSGGKMHKIRDEFGNSAVFLGGTSVGVSGLECGEGLQPERTAHA